MYHNRLKTAHFPRHQQTTSLLLPLPPLTRGATVEEKASCIVVLSMWGLELREDDKISPKMSHQRQEHTNIQIAIHLSISVLSVSQTSIREPSADTLKPRGDTHKHVYTVSRLTLSGQSALVSLPLISSPAFARWEVQHIIPQDFHSYAQGVSNEAGKQQ